MGHLTRGRSDCIDDRSAPPATAYGNGQKRLQGRARGVDDQWQRDHWRAQSLQSRVDVRSVRTTRRQYFVVSERKMTHEISTEEEMVT